MIKRGFTEDDIAQMMGVTTPTVLRWISRKGMPRRVRTLAAILGVTVSDLWSENPLTEEERYLQKRTRELEQQHYQAALQLLAEKTRESEGLKNHSLVFVGQY
ncbi:helix-turn-helix transcriptional regulator [Runella sp. MFBS21]|nr:helix-turn-helix transcriptional regulator [Runella sp. MFBS21]MDF7822312.1 helix-turn-helix transcriptional regulator [Runella sp. MFBS21]